MKTKRTHSKNRIETHAPSNQSKFKTTTTASPLKIRSKPNKIKQSKTLNQLNNKRSNPSQTLAKKKSKTKADRSNAKSIQNQDKVQIKKPKAKQEQSQKRSQIQTRIKSTPSKHYKINIKTEVDQK